MTPALFLIPLVALFRIFLAWQPAGYARSSWLPGFCPMSAVALCAGAFLARRLALVVPLTILVLSDAIIDAHYGASLLDPSMATRYVLLALIGVLGMSLRRAPEGANLAGVLLGTVIGSTLFYTGSIFACWLGSAQYPQTFAGLVQSLTTGLPGYPPSYVFFRNGLVSDLLYSIVFVACVRRAFFPWKVRTAPRAELPGTPHAG